MWTVVYMAQSEEAASKLKGVLIEDGILVKLRPINKNNIKKDNYYEILVPETEVEEAHNVIIEKGY